VSGLLVIFLSVVVCSSSSSSSSSSVNVGTCMDFSLVVLVIVQLVLFLEHSRVAWS
jgi:hypothetical protein